MSETSIIRALDALTIDQMAAGEVVDRPASVAKELVENALDAGASQITVDLVGGGLERLQVTDNGLGMSAEDAARCIERHATSKLRSLDDLMRLHTLGFRGEALSSIASVSRLTLTTRQARDAVGTRVVVVGGALVSQEPVGCPVGTRIEVADLFYNVPARRKFMRAPATEQAHVQEALLKVALAARRGGIVVQAAGRRLLDIPAGAEANARITLALGASWASCATLEHEAHGIEVRGLVGLRQGVRADARRLWLFVNGRFVRDRSLQRAVAQALDGLAALEAPTALVFIDLPADEVDVNVHPQKLEVRFRHVAQVHAAAQEGLTLAVQALLAERRAAVHTAPQALGLTPVRSAPLGQRAFRGATGGAWRAPATRPVLAGGQRTAWAPVPAPASRDFEASAPAPQDLALFAELEAPQATSVWARLEPLAIAPKGYLCCRDGDALVFVNVALAEAAALAHALASDAGRRPAPMMMPPTWVPEPELTSAVDDYVIETVDTPGPYGVALEAVGPGQYVVVSTPEALHAYDGSQVAQALLAALAAQRAACSDVSPETVTRVVAAWVQALTRSWTGPHGMGPSVWAPGWLGRLAAAGVVAAPPMAHRMAAEDVAALRAPPVP